MGVQSPVALWIGFLLMAGAFWCSGGAAWAQTIRLKKGRATVTGDVLRLDDDRVIIGLRRADIQTIDGTALPAPLVEGTPAPTFSAMDIQGHVQSVGQGDAKVTVLHFWVTWCPHCRSDAPQIQALNERFRDNPAVRVVTVSLDQTRAPLDTFVQEHQVTYPVVFASEAASGPNPVDLPKLYEVSGFPVTFVIDQRGVIRRKIHGSFVETRVDLGALIQSFLPTS